MGEWALEVNKKLERVNGHTPQLSINEAAMAEELAGLWRRYVSPIEEMAQHQKNIAAKELELAEINDEIELIESQASLDIAADVDEKGKPVHSNESARKAAAKLVLGIDEEYKQLVERQRLIEVDIKNSKIDIELCDALVKEFHYRNRALVARIQYDTAVINSLQGDK